MMEYKEWYLRWKINCSIVPSNYIIPSVLITSQFSYLVIRKIIILSAQL